MTTSGHMARATVIAWRPFMAPKTSCPSKDYGAQVTELCLQAVGLDARRIAAVMAYELPTLAHEVRERRAG